MAVLQSVGAQTVLAQADLRLSPNFIDYVFVVFYFVLVLGIGLLARRSVASSLDFLLSRKLKADPMPEPLADAYAWSLAFLALGIPFLMLLPKFGAALLVGALATFVYGRYARA